MRHKSSDVLNFSAPGTESHRSSMLQLAEAATHIEQLEEEDHLLFCELGLEDEHVHSYLLAAWVECHMDERCYFEPGAEAENISL